MNEDKLRELEERCKSKWQQYENSELDADISIREK